MIERITDLNLKNFRALRSERNITLDGDVVLIYGSNGTGKSSLLSAIELVLTGSIPELARYGTDYPRCLRHVLATDSTVVEAKYKYAGGQVHTSACQIGPDDKFTARGDQLTGLEKTLFSERCYLSQVRLSRLLDAYQSAERGGTDAPIVQFVKRLLSLDSLESLSEGLHDIEDVRRTRKTFIDVSFLEDEERKVAALKSELAEDIRVQAINRTESAAALQSLLKPFDQTVKAGELDANAITQLIGQLTQRVESLRGSALTSVEQDLQRIRQMRVLFQQEEGDADVRLAGLTGRLTDVELRRTEIIDKLQPALDAAKAITSKIGVASDTSRAHAFSGEWRRTELQLQALNNDLQSTINARRSEAMKKNELITIKGLKEANLQQIQDSVRQLASAVPQWAETLAKLASAIDGDICPVCQRDFAETQQGSLRNYVTQRAARIGADARKLQDAETTRMKLLRELEDIDRSLAALSSRDEVAPSISAVETDLVQTRTALEQLTALNTDLDAWIEASNVAMQLQSEIKLSQAMISQMTDARATLLEIAGRVKVDVAAGLPITHGLDTVELACSAMLEAHTKRIADLGTLQDVLREYANLLSEADVLDHRWLTLNERLQKTEEARKRVDAAISKSKVVLKAAVATKRKLLDRVFDETLNELWTELFERLVRNELFKPRLSEARSMRDHIRATLQAVVDGVEVPFENVAAVQSLGNQNTSALSLFLALNLLASPCHNSLILDDPVQSMDDVHVSQFAVLVRELVSQANRQVFVAVHERALFEYLSFELAPSAPSRHLITIELERTSDAADCITRVERRGWQQQTVQLEVASRAS